MAELVEERVGWAVQAGLRYVGDREPGIRRIRCGKGFLYRDPRGKPVSAEVRDRCKALVVPPAWTDVWICSSPDGHIQAIGRDAKGRKQYRYHQEWQLLRQMMKYDRLLEFGRSLPSLRERVRNDLGRPGLPQEKVLATVVELMAKTLIRVGNAEYARDNDSYGLTTIRSDHVQVEGTRIRFGFRGKSGKLQEVDLADRRMARIVRRCQELQGQELFAWVDREDRVHDIRSEDVNQYLRSMSGQDWTAKEFRTWGGTVEAFDALRAAGPAPSQAARKRVVSQCIKQVARQLGNTPTVCRTYYVHPVVLEAHADGRLFAINVPRAPKDGLEPSELGLVTLLEDSTREERVA